MLAKNSLNWASSAFAFCACVHIGSHSLKLNLLNSGRLDIHEENAHMLPKT